MLITQLVFSLPIPEKIIKHEVKYYYKAYKVLRNNMKRAENKSKRIGHRNRSLFLGGIKLSLCPQCVVKKKRTKKENEFIKKLSKSEKIKLNNKIKSELKKKHPKLSNEIVDMLF